MFTLETPNGSCHFGHAMWADVEKDLKRTYTLTSTIIPIGKWNPSLKLTRSFRCRSLQTTVGCERGKSCTVRLFAKVARGNEWKLMLMCFKLLFKESFSFPGYSQLALIHQLDMLDSEYRVLSGQTSTFPRAFDAYNHLVDLYDSKFMWQYCLQRAGQQLLQHQPYGDEATGRGSHVMATYTSPEVSEVI